MAKGETFRLSLEEKLTRAEDGAHFCHEASDSEEWFVSLSVYCKVSDCFSVGGTLGRSRIRICLPVGETVM